MKATRRRVAFILFCRDEALPRLCNVFINCNRVETHCYASQINNEDALQCVSTIFSKRKPLNVSMRERCFCLFGVPLIRKAAHPVQSHSVVWSKEGRPLWGHDPCRRPWAIRTVGISSLTT